MYETAWWLMDDGQLPSAPVNLRRTLLRHRPPQPLTIKQITTDDPLYVAERELRNRVLLRPLGLPDGAWEMHDAAAHHFVALAGERLVGCALLVPDGKDGTRARLIQMAVDPGVQGQGVGKGLIQELLRYAAAAGFHEVHCHSRTYAKAFYHK